MPYRCHYRGQDPATSAWWSEGDDSDWASNIVCTFFAENPNSNPRMTYVDPTNANYGLSPSGPNAPAKDPVTGILTTVYGDTTTGGKATAKAKSAKSAKSATAGGCCEPGEPKCLWCWLKDNWIQLAILILAVAAFVTRKK